jgi:predicted nucleotide-binding protein
VSPYYHVRLTPKSDRSETEVKLDLSQEELEARFLQSYREGRPIVIGGRTIPPDDIERIRINVTDEPSERILPIILEERRQSSVITMVPNDWYVAAYGADVTDEFITGPPGTGVAARTGTVPLAVEGPRVVFVVHGRDRAARDGVFTFLRAIGLHPLEWAEALAATGKPAPYIGDVLDLAFAVAQAVVVLMTPDDDACLRPHLRGPGEPPHETQPTGQARANVLFEAGMTMGRAPDRTVLVELGELRPFSDIAGRHVVRLDNSTPRRQEFAQRLIAAGCPVNLTGMDWHTAGNLAPSPPIAEEMIDEHR